MWPFKKRKSTPPVKDPLLLHMESLKEGDVVMFDNRKPVRVIHNDCDYWDLDYFIPTVTVAYEDRNGIIREHRFTPREAFAALKAIV